MVAQILQDLAFLITFSFFLNLKLSTLWWRSFKVHSEVPNMAFKIADENVLKAEIWLICDF